MPFISKRSLAVIGILSAILLVGGVTTYLIFLSPTGYKAREDADLTKVLESTEGVYTNLEGDSVKLQDFRDKVMVVNVWASWSPYTAGEFEVLSKLKATYGDKISVVALNRKESKETAVAYLDTIGKKDGIEYVIDTTDHFFNSFEGYAMPETLIFDEVGNEQFRKRGVLDYDETAATIKTLLGE